MMKRAILVVLGTIFTGLAVLGVFLPLLPTTPFLLLAAACYARSSDRFYNLLVNHRWLGPYISNYRDKKGMKLKAKVIALALLWLTLGYSAIFAVDALPARILLAVVAAGVSAHILHLKTLKDGNKMKN